MNRRDFITVLGAALASPLAAHAQSSQRRLIGFLGGSAQASATLHIDAFVQGLRDFGHEPGKDVDIAYQWADGDVKRLPGLANELIALRPDVILSASGPGNPLLVRLTNSIPIVGALIVDPVGLGLAESYNHPGRNFTGILVTLDSLPAKQVELLLRIIPRARAVGVLTNPTNPSNTVILRNMQASLKDGPVKIVPVQARNPAELEQAFDALKRERVDGLLVLVDLVFFSEAARILAFAEATRLPTLHPHHEHVEQGGLMSYGVDTKQNFRRAGYFIDRILRGERPGNLPIELPTKLELVINLKTAKVLGLDIPPTVLATADQVIE